MGVVLWIMLTGSHPWPIHCDPIAGVQSISFGQEWDGISKVATELIKSMLEIDPAARISSEALVKHPWLSGDGINSTQSAQGGGKSNGRSHLERAQVV